MYFYISGVLNHKHRLSFRTKGITDVDSPSPSPRERGSAKGIIALAFAGRLGLRPVGAVQAFRLYGRQWNDVVSPAGSSCNELMIDSHVFLNQTQFSSSWTCTGLTPLIRMSRCLVAAGTRMPPCTCKCLAEERKATRRPQGARRGGRASGRRAVGPSPSPVCFPLGMKAHLITDM